MRIGNKVFISYSDKDTEWLNKLQTMLAPLQRKGTISAWDNTKIKTGDITEEQIKNALAKAKIAVLLVSDYYLASDDIFNRELSPLLKAAEQEGLRIIWICVSDCLYEENEIDRYKAAHDINQPLDTLSQGDLNRVLADIARKILQAADYLKELREYLENKNWKKADKETTQLMLKAIEQEQRDWLKEEDIENIDCYYLEEIDKLWVEHSGNLFGFSIQKEIWEEIYKSFNNNYDRAKEEFSIHKVGWCQRYPNGLECLRNRLQPQQAFNNKIKGYLPTPPPMTRSRNEIQVRSMVAIVNKLETCSN